MEFSKPISPGIKPSPRPIFYQSFGSSTMSPQLPDHLKGPSSSRASSRASLSQLGMSVLHTSEIQDFETLKGLRDEVSTLRGENFNLKVQVFQLEESLQKVEGIDIDDVRRTMARSRMASSIVSELEKKDAILNKSRYDIGYLEQREQILSTRIEASQNETRHLKQKLDEMKSETSDLEKKLKVKNEECAEKETQLSQQLVELSSLKGKEELMKQEKKTSDQTISNLKDEFDALFIKHRDLQHSFDSLKSESEHVKIAFEETKQDVNILRVRYDSCLHDLEETKFSLLKREGEMQELKDSLEKQTKELNSSQAERRKLESKVSSIRLECERKDNSTSRLDTEVSALKVELESIKKENIRILEEKKIQKEEIRGLEKERDSLKKENLSFSHDKEALISENEDLRARINRFYVSCEESRSLSQSLVVEREEQQDQLIKITSERDKYFHTAKKYKQKILDIGKKMKEALVSQREAAEAAAAWKQRCDDLASHIISATQKRSDNTCCLTLATNILQVVALFADE
ncbi:hypothetical protein ADUPG1_000087 [Aduncisulcus paluster]|uniref:Centrosomin N-terminal motif 1 domain-containing protein n=1 Tax=Aduncisulcus paluster TaxID=2918883 RepID=A0ABQ5K4P8_9EUKA|nr:hypothetical protein ADUPG1_000087 [Aduncisulcus paluster]